MLRKIIVLFIRQNLATYDFLGLFVTILSESSFHILLVTVTEIWFSLIDLLLA